MWNDQRRCFLYRISRKKHRYQSYNLCNQNNTKGDAEKRCFFSHWFHAPTFTGSQSVEQDTNVNNVLGKIFLFLTDQSIQVKIFKMLGASCAILVCNSSTRKRGIVIFRVPTWNQERGNNWGKDVINIVTRDRVVDKILKDKIDIKNIYLCEKLFPEEQLLRFKHSPYFEILFEVICVFVSSA